ncbi:MAG: hypothetical protein ABWY00_05985, partial [Dongiaceae bacterium]
ELLGQGFHLGGGNILARNKDILVERHLVMAPSGCCTVRCWGWTLRRAENPTERQSVATSACRA